MNKQDHPNNVDSIIWINQTLCKKKDKYHIVQVSMLFWHASCAVKILLKEQYGSHWRPWW